MSSRQSRPSERRVFQERTPSENNRLQIRLVPYTPPRLSFDGSLPTSSGAGSEAETPVARKATLGPSPDIRTSGKTKSRTLSHGQEDAARDGSSRHVPAEASAGAATKVHGNQGPKPPPSSMGFFTRGIRARSKQPTQSPESTSLRHWPKIAGFNADKFFPSLPYSVSASSATYSSKSAQQSPAISASSRQPSSSHVFTTDQPSSLQTLNRDYAFSQGARPVLEETGASPPSTWNYRLVGSLRKVNRSSAISKSRPHSQAAGTTNSHLGLLARFRRSELSSRREIEPPRTPASGKYHSSEFGRFETTNFDSRARDPSNAAPATTRSTNISSNSDLEVSSLATSRPNVEVFGESVSGHSVSDLDARSDANYVTYGDASPSLTSRRKSDLSRDSLQIAPLQPPRGKSAQFAGVSRARSYTSSHAGSLSSVSTGIIIEEATRSLLSGGTPICVSASASRQTSSSRPLDVSGSNSRWTLFRQPQWSIASSNDASRLVGSGRAVEETDAIADAASTSEQGEIIGVGRSMIKKSGHKRTKSTSKSAEGPTQPSPAYRRASSRDPNPHTIRLIRNQDEHGDGLTDLQSLGHHSNRSRLHSLLSSHPSDRNLHSSSSARSGSFSRSPIPTWARVYYGSGERKFLAAKISSESLFSDFTSYSGGTSFLSRSPSAERFPTTLRSPRRRPREPGSPVRRTNTPSQCEDSEIGSGNLSPWISRLRHQPSSIWSPHLRRDRRASGYGIWEPPSAVWSTNTSFMSRKNIQPIMFVVGFVFPLAWAIASFLPLPRISGPDMAQIDTTNSHLNLQLEANPTMEMWDMRLYNHARWWRTLNRAMSIVGIFVIGAVVALIVFGVRQRWKS